MVDDTADLLADCDLDTMDPKTIFELVTKNPEGAVRALLLGRLGREDRFLASTKRIYTVGQFALRPNGSSGSSETYLAPCHIGGGPGPDQRQTECVRLKHLSIKMTVTRLAGQAVGSTNARIAAPIMSFIVFRDKVPESAGTSPIVWIKDGINPPRDQYAVMSCLDPTSLSPPGNIQAFTSIAVQNPCTSAQYHIYKLVHHELNSGMQFTAVTDVAAPSTTPSGQPWSKTWRFEYNIPLHGVKQQYVTSTAQPTLNDIWMAWTTDIDYTNLQYQDTVCVTTETTFDDVPYE